MEEVTCLVVETANGFQHDAGHLIGASVGVWTSVLQVAAAVGGHVGGQATRAAVKLTCAQPPPAPARISIGMLILVSSSPKCLEKYPRSISFTVSLNAFSSVASSASHRSPAVSNTQLSST